MAEAPWWKDYRRRIYGNRRSMSLEMIFRKSLREAATEFVHQSSLGGIKQIVDGDIGVIQRLIWIVIFIITFCVISYFLQYLWFDTLTKPLIVTMESSTYPISLIDFPAIALCNVNRLSKKAVLEYSKQIYPFLARNNESLEEVEWFNLETGRLLDYSYDDSIRNHPFLDLVAKTVFDTSHIVKRMKQLAPSCDDMLVKCTWAAKVVNCSSIFDVRRTVRGHCCAFNVVSEFNAGGRPNKTIAEVKRQDVAGVLNGLSVILDPMLDDYAYPLSSIEGFDVFLFDPRHYADPSGGRIIQRFLQTNTQIYFEIQSVKQVATEEVRQPNKTIAEVKRQDVAGVLNGLSVILDPMLDDYAYPLSSIEGFDVFLFDPRHYADPSGGRIIQRFLQTNTQIYFEIQSVKQVATEEVRQYPVKTRKCLFHDERPDMFGDMYSYSGCIVNCRIRTVQSLCKCTPYFMPIKGDGPICSLDDLFCLNKYKEKFLYLYPMGVLDERGLELELQDSLHCPECLPDCELTKHYSRSAVIPLPYLQDAWSEKWFVRKFFAGVNLTNKCAMTLYQSTNDGTLDRLDVVVYWFEILSSIGGFNGVLVGFSIIGLVECFYFVVVRFSQIMYQNLRLN